MAESRILSTVMIEPKAVINDGDFWNYFLTYAFLQRFRPEKERKLKEYLEKKCHVDYEWVEKFTNCATPGIENVDFVKMLSFHNMPGNIAGSEIYFYKDNIKYTRSENGIRLSSKRFLSRTKKWSLKERLLLCPFVTVEEHDEKEFHKVLEGGLIEAGIGREDVGTLAFLILDCCKSKKVLIQNAKENIRNDNNGDKIVNSWYWGFLLTVVLAYCIAFLFKTNSWIGIEGLKRVMVSGFKFIPLFIYMAVSAVVFWSVMYKSDGDNNQNERIFFKKSKIKGFVIGFLVALPFMVVAALGAVYLVENSVYALIDYNNLVIESVVLKNPTFREDDGYAWGRYGRHKVEPAHYVLEMEELDFSFNIPLDYDVKEVIEKHLEDGVVVYYYKNSHVVQSIRCKDKILVGE